MLVTAEDVREVRDEVVVKVSDDLEVQKLTMRNPDIQWTGHAGDVGPLAEAINLRRRVEVPHAVPRARMTAAGTRGPHGRSGLAAWPLSTVAILVPEPRFELGRPCGPRSLSPLRLPFRHSGAGPA